MCHFPVWPRGGGAGVGVTPDTGIGAWASGKGPGSSWRGPETSGGSSAMTTSREMIPSSWGQSCHLWSQDGGRTLFPRRLSAWMGQERSLLTAAEAKDGEGANG